jgi:hypothetical protein
MPSFNTVVILLSIDWGWLALFFSFAAICLCYWDPSSMNYIYINNLLTKDSVVIFRKFTFPNNNTYAKSPMSPCLNKYSPFLKKPIVNKTNNSFSNYTWIILLIYRDTSFFFDLIMLSILDLKSFNVFKYCITSSTTYSSGFSFSINSLMWFTF